jgi:hypothetical protein
MQSEKTGTDSVEYQDVDKSQYPREQTKGEICCWKKQKPCFIGQPISEERMFRPDSKSRVCYKTEIPPVIVNGKISDRKYNEFAQNVY